jgi:hypothetical protein
LPEELPPRPFIFFFEDDAIDNKQETREEEREEEEKEKEEEKLGCGYVQWTFCLSGIWETAE